MASGLTAMVGAESRVAASQRSLLAQRLPAGAFPFPLLALFAAFLIFFSSIAFSTACFSTRYGSVVSFPAGSSGSETNTCTTRKREPILTHDKNYTDHNLRRYCNSK
jgi:hypothetical protein